MYGGELIFNAPLASIDTPTGAMPVSWSFLLLNPVSTLDAKLDVGNLLA